MTRSTATLAVSLHIFWVFRRAGHNPTAGSNTPVRPLGLGVYGTLAAGLLVAHLLLLTAILAFNCRLYSCSRPYLAVLPVAFGICVLGCRWRRKGYWLIAGGSLLYAVFCALALILLIGLNGSGNSRDILLFTSAFGPGICGALTLVTLLLLRRRRSIRFPRTRVDALTGAGTPPTHPR